MIKYCNDHNLWGKWMFSGSIYSYFLFPDQGRKKVSGFVGPILHFSEYLRNWAWVRGLSVKQMFFLWASGVRWARSNVLHWVSRKPLFWHEVVALWGDSWIVFCWAIWINSSSSFYFIFFLLLTISEIFTNFFVFISGFESLDDSWLWLGLILVLEKAESGVLPLLKFLHFSDFLAVKTKTCSGSLGGSKNDRLCSTFLFFKEILRGLYWVNFLQSFVMVPFSFLQRVLCKFRRW